MADKFDKYKQILDRENEEFRQALEALHYIFLNLTANVKSGWSGYYCPPLNEFLHFPVIHSYS